MARKLKSRKMTPVTIPLSRATLRIPLDSLRRLPGGAIYQERDGRATVSATVKDGTLVVHAECDSLQQLVYELEERLSAQREQASTRKEIKVPSPTPVRTRLKWYSSGVLTGLIAALLWTHRKRKKGNHPP